MSGLIMKYFVLKPGGSDEYAWASRQAMLTYADAIAEVNPELAEELTQWVNRTDPVLKKARGEG